ncbi:MAG: hypothetical protein FWE56_00380 [Candidatus Bathyarchaeota archaeon]|nr:hypothetical protein [Candidatus Termiticorpusculum sp.]MCL2868048.1 hypothetical protein [Candidatus Termiticorpusculum sp.]
MAKPIPIPVLFDEDADAFDKWAAEPLTPSEQEFIKQSLMACKKTSVKSKK